MVKYSKEMEWSRMEERENEKRTHGEESESHNGVPLFCAQTNRTAKLQKKQRSDEKKMSFDTNKNEIESFEVIVDQKRLMDEIVLR